MQETGSAVVRFDLCRGRHLDRTNRQAARAALVKGAARGHAELARRFALRQPKVAHPHPARVGDPLHPEIVRDEDVGQTKPLLQVENQPQDLRADGNVERRDGLIEHDDVGVQDERPPLPPYLSVDPRAV
jgi:hypothetical protein